MAPGFTWPTSGNDWGHRRVENDLRDAEGLVDLLRLGRVAEARVASPEIRELRGTKSP